MAKRIIIGNADFSHNAIEIRHKLVSSMLTQGLIDAVPGTGIRPPSGGNDYMNRVSLITDTAISSYSKVTIPTGMQWAATFFDENGDCVSTVNASWVKNQTGQVKTFDLSEANSYVSTAYYFHISFGYIDGSQLNVADFDTTVSIYLDKSEPIPEPTELRLTSSMVEIGMMDIDGSINLTPPRDKRVSYRHQTFLTEYSRIYIPNNIKWGVLYRNDEDETVNTSDTLNKWTETPGSTGGGIVDITSALKQDFSQSPTATSYYLTFAKIASGGSTGTDYLTPEELDTTYEIKLLPPSND